MVGILRLGGGVPIHHGDVLVVDDDAGSRLRLTGILEGAGYTTLGLASAEDALASIAERWPDLVVTEVQLPGISGYELCRRIREQYEDGPAVMIVSGDRARPFDRATGILLGAEDYMVKPVDPEELLARVWRIFRRLHGRHGTNGNAGRGEANGDSRLDLLTARERQVLDLLADGSVQGDIAQALFISPKTVAAHIQHILTKLGVHNRTQAVALALRSGRR